MPPFFEDICQSSVANFSVRVDNMTVKKLGVQDLYSLTELFDYNDVQEMISKCTHDIQNNLIDIFGLYVGSVLVGELRVKYHSEDDTFAVCGRRAYLYAFRVRNNYQGKGCGKFLIKKVISMLKENGYQEFTVGVEDDNLKAMHIYQSLGFHELLLRKQEEYQGDTYEYNLYLLRTHA